MCIYDLEIQYRNIYVFLPCHKYIEQPAQSRSRVVSRGQTAYFPFYIQTGKISPFPYFPRPNIKRKISGLATRD